MTARPGDTLSLACSLPLVKLAARMRGAAPGALFEACSDSFGFEDDVRRWCGATGNEMCGVAREGNITRIVVRKARGAAPAAGGQHDRKNPSNHDV